MTDPTFRKRLIVGVIVLATGLCVYGYITGAQWLAFVGGLVA